MRPRFSFPSPADEILRRADKIELTIHRTKGKTFGISYVVHGTLLDPFVDGTDDDTLDPHPADAEEARRLLEALLAEGGVR